MFEEKLIAAGSELLERVAADHADNIPEEARAVLTDKDTGASAALEPSTPRF